MTKCAICWRGFTIQETFGTRYNPLCWFDWKYLVSHSRNPLIADRIKWTAPPGCKFHDYDREKITGALGVPRSLFLCVFDDE